MTIEFSGKRVMIESPYRNGDRARNLRYLAWCEYDSACRGEFPVASHGNCPQYWPEDDEHRAMGFAWRESFVQTVAAVICYWDLGLSEGASLAIEKDRAAGRIVEFRRLSMGHWLVFLGGEWPPGTMRKVPV